MDPDLFHAPALALPSSPKVKQKSRATALHSRWGEPSLPALNALEFSELFQAPERELDWLLTSAPRLLGALRQPVRDEILAAGDPTTARQ